LEGEKKSLGSSTGAYSLGKDAYFSSDPEKIKNDKRRERAGKYRRVGKAVEFG